MKRKVLTISLSYSNPDAITVMKALHSIQEGQRSAALVRWAAAYLNGKVVSDISVIDDSRMSEQEFDDLLDSL